MKKNIRIIAPSEMVDNVLFDMSHYVLDEPLIEHSHDCIEIGFTLSGNAVQVRGDATEKLRRGDVFIILPGGSHRMPECHGFEHINISCSADILTRTGVNLGFIHGMKELFDNPQRSVSFHLTNSEFNDARQLIDTMFRAYRRNRAEEQGNLRSYFAMLICLMAQSFSLHHNSQSVAGRMDGAVAYINEHYKGKLLLPEIAGMASLSVSQFVRVFRKQYDTTPIDYVLELRLNEARRLLQFSNMSVSEIAYHVGFNDTNYFSRLFKKKYGHPPSQIRR